MAFLTTALRRITSRLAWAGAFRVATLSDADILTHSSAQIQVLDPGGSSRDVTLTSEGVGDDGYFFVVVNTADAAENLVLKDAGGSTIATIPENGWGVVYMDGSQAWAKAFVVTAANIT